MQIILEKLLLCFLEIFFWFGVGIRTASPVFLIIECVKQMIPHKNYKTNGEGRCLMSLEWHMCMLDIQYHLSHDIVGEGGFVMISFTVKEDTWAPQLINGKK